MNPPSLKLRRTKIGIDAKFFGAKDRGIGRYVENLIRNLEKIDGENQYIVFLEKERWNDYQPENPNFSKAPFKDFKKYNLDLMHFTYFKAPIFYKGKFIVTIHDLIFSHIGFLKRIAYKIILKSALKRAEKIIAVSEFTKKEILRKYHINPDKIKVIYEGVSPARSAKRSFGGRGKPYILYVGNDYPHKNLKRLCLAFKKLNLDYQLVLITDFVSDEELNKLYRNASLFVFPSLIEGFGLPPLEAMARGVPVACSNTGSLPEILGEAVVYFNPLDIDDMAEKMRSILSNDGIKKTLSNDRVKKDLIEKGFEQVKKYNWGKMAKETLRVYKNIVIQTD